jgi:hypothetical protein
MAIDDVVIGLEEVVDVSNQGQRRFGTAGSFPSLFREAWKEDIHVFTAEGGNLPLDAYTQRLGLPERVAANVLNRHPVDVLAIEEPPSISKKPQQRFWVKWLDKCQQANLPNYVLISAPAKELVEADGLQTKPWRRRFQEWGYEAHYWFLRAHEHGGVVRQDRCMLVLRRQDDAVPRVRIPETIETEGGPRTARNMLKPMGIPREGWLREEWTPRDDYPEWVTEAAKPCIIVGETVKRKTPIFSPDGCLPDFSGTLVATDRGVRRLLPEELAKAKGVPSEWTSQGGMKTRDINSMTSLHLWAAVAASLDATPPLDPGQYSTPSTPLEQEPIWMAGGGDGPDWQWRAPDLNPGSDWHMARVANLKVAVRGLPDEQEQWTKGLEALKIHRKNYEGEGSIHKLQLLWWEFPPEHWEDLRNGCAMNFLSEPTAGVKENSPMTDEQVEIAAEFIDELWHIGVFELIPDECEMKTNAPLFAVAKAGQPGQWRIIADMKSGGQNEHIGKDPTHLPRAHGILERLYTGGWSAIVDASKFFHNFPTRPSDRPYLGCIHPKTGQRLWYLGLPMGSAQSPSLACRYGLSMLRSLVEKETVFQGETRENSWRSRLANSGYDPHLGSGLVKIGRDGLPAALIWAFVDDFKIHAPTKAKLIVALNAFMDLALRLGLICQEVKTKAPSQVQKYCGFIYDTTGIPTLRIPEDKRERGLAMIRFLRAGESSLQLSRLTLAVVTGLLQSLVEATPQRIGQTFLRRLYTRLHELEGARPKGAAFFYTRVALTPEDWLDLTWWEEALQLNISVQAFSSRQGTLGISFGDGSGSGTGGTVQILGHTGTCPIMEAWMGTWRPRVHSFSSNWKELRTLVHTLERELGGQGRLHNATLFYFTDNLVTYYIVSGGSSASPELQHLIRRIKYLELVLGIRLEVVHVPGLHMIDQRTDGLSRGIRFAGGRLKRSPESETLRVFEALPATRKTRQWIDACTRNIRRHATWTHMDGTRDWTFHQVSGQATIWFPAPEWAHQVMDAVVNAWAENPWNTEAFFVVPRVFQRNWGRASKHIVEVGTYAAATIPDYGGTTDIPCVVLHLPCYIRSLPPSKRMESPSRPAGAQWHWEQAEYVRGLS